MADGVRGGLVEQVLPLHHIAERDRGRFGDGWDAVVLVVMFVLVIERVEQSLRRLATFVLVVHVREDSLLHVHSSDPLELRFFTASERKA